jgi:hypothetical protein
VWLADTVAAAAGDQVPTSTIVAGVVALASAALAAWLGARGTLRTADTAREVEFDKRVDGALVREQQQNESLRADRDKYRELYVELRIAVIGEGLDPDEIVSKGATHGHP